MCGRLFYKRYKIRGGVLEPQQPIFFKKVKKVINDYLNNKLDVFFKGILLFWGGGCCGTTTYLVSKSPVLNSSVLKKISKAAS